MATRQTRREGHDITAFTPFLTQLRGVKHMKLMCNRRDEKKILLIGEYHEQPPCPGFEELPILPILSAATARYPVDFMLEVPDTYTPMAPGTLQTLRADLAGYLPRNEGQKRFPHARVHWLEFGWHSYTRRDGKALPTWLLELDSLKTHFITKAVEPRMVEYPTLLRHLFRCTGNPGWLEAYKAFVANPTAGKELVRGLYESVHDTAPDAMYHVAFRAIDSLKQVYRFNETKCPVFDTPMLTRVFWTFVLHKIKPEANGRFVWTYYKFLEFLFAFQRFSVDIYTLCRILSPARGNNVVVYAGANHTYRLAEMLRHFGYGHLRNALKTKKYPAGIRFNPRCKSRKAHLSEVPAVPAEQEDELDLYS